MTCLFVFLTSNGAISVTLFVVFFKKPKLFLRQLNSRYSSGAVLFTGLHFFAVVRCINIWKGWTSIAKDGLIFFTF